MQHGVVHTAKGLAHASHLLKPLLPVLLALVHELHAVGQRHDDTSRCRLERDGLAAKVDAADVDGSRGTPDATAGTAGGRASACLKVDVRALEVVGRLSDVGGLTERKRVAARPSVALGREAGGKGRVVGGSGDGGAGLGGSAEGGGGGVCRRVLFREVVERLCRVGDAALCLRLARGCAGKGKCTCVEWGAASVNNLSTYMCGFYIKSRVV